MTEALRATETRARLERVVPALGWIRRYDRRWLVPDIVGGLAAGAVVIPQAMAYATVANLPVEVGLYTCIVPMAVYALLGGSRTLSVSTTSTIAILTASTFLAAGIAAGGTDPAGDLATLTVLVGVILLVARLLRVSAVIDNISEATLTGIKIGVGLTVAASQLPKLLGVAGDPAADNFFESLHAVGQQLDDVSGVTVAFSVVTLGGLLGCRRLWPKVPATLLAVVGGIAVVALTSISDHGLAVIPEVPSGLPAPIWPDFDHLGQLAPGAFAIAIMVFLETLAVARSVRRPKEPPIDNDGELVANGLSCLAGGFFRAMPSAGGFSQTAINQSAGARTQLSELVTVGLAVASALVLGGLLSDLPEATLGCMVLVAVLGLIKPAELVRLWRLSRLEFWVATVTAVSGLCFGLLVAVLVGVVLTLYLVLRELDRLGLTELQPTDGGEIDLRAAGPHTHPVPGLLTLRFDGPLYTANVRSANRKVLAAVAAHPGTEVVVLEASATGVMSTTVVGQMGDLDRELSEQGIGLWVAALPPRVLVAAKRLPRWTELERDGRLFPTALAALRQYESL